MLIAHSSWKMFSWKTNNKIKCTDLIYCHSPCKACLISSLFLGNLFLFMRIMMLAVMYWRKIKYRRNIPTKSVVIIKYEPENVKPPKI